MGLGLYYNTRRFFEHCFGAMYELWKSRKTLIPDLYRKGKITDRQFLTWVYWKQFKKVINWRHPQTFNEKVQWIKLYDRRKEYSRIVDKLEFKNWLREKIGDGYTVPVIAIWNDFEEIDEKQLPAKFVLKTNHTSGTTYIHTGKVAPDKDKIRSILGHRYDLDLYIDSCEWAYKDVKRKIFAEELLEYDNPLDGVSDYKFLCFNGVPHYVQFFSAQEDHYFRDVEKMVTSFQAFYDMNWNRLDMKQGMPFENQIEIDIPRPIKFEEMKDIARQLSDGFPFVRVDFFEIEGKIYLSELTFCPYSGKYKFNPEEWDMKLGKLWDLGIS